MCFVLCMSCTIYRQNIYIYIFALAITHSWTIFFFSLSPQCLSSTNTKLVSFYFFISLAFFCCFLYFIFFSQSLTWNFYKNRHINIYMYCIYYIISRALNYKGKIKWKNQKRKTDLGERKTLLKVMLRYFFYLFWYLRLSVTRLW